MKITAFEGIVVFGIIASGIAFYFRDILVDMLSSKRGPARGRSPDELCFRGTRLKATPSVAGNFTLALFFAAVSLHVKGELFLKALLWVLTAWLGYKFLISFYATILNTPYLRLDSEGFTYWPGVGTPSRWKWSDVAKLETRRGNLGHQDELWEHETRFDTLIVYHRTSASLHAGELGPMRPYGENGKQLLTIALPPLGSAKQIVLSMKAMHKKWAGNRGAVF